MRFTALGVAVMLGTPGCGVMMSQSPDPDRGPHETPRCSESEGGVVLDGLFTSFYGIGGLAAIGSGFFASLAFIWTKKLKRESPFTIIFYFAFVFCIVNFKYLFIC